MTEEYHHIPVLPVQTLKWSVAPDGMRRVIDGTVGYGGHSSLILKHCPDAELMGVDHDGAALDEAAKTLSFAASRVHLVRGDFSHMTEYAAGLGWQSVDSILLDIGVSSPQIDNPERGFSFRFDGPLDMRMDPRKQLTAADIVNSYPPRELTRIFRDYGEIREASRLANAIVREREKAPFDTSLRLAELCDRVLTHPAKRHSGPPAPTLAFQALRIEVNDELGELERALTTAVDLLSPGGRITVISFHSLEDRIVKRFFLDMAALCKCPPGCPQCICGWKPKLRILTRKPVTAEADELEVNPRAACAKLRSAEKI